MGKHSADVPAWHKVPAPGEELLPAPLPPVTKATADNAGCWVDGARGWAAPIHMVDIAVERGWPITDEDQEILDLVKDRRGDCDRETWQELCDDVESWLNDHVAPEGFSFGWHDGDFVLWTLASWCEVSGDKCCCVEPHPLAGDR